ncbi:MAG: DUF2892 domain-containing protein [Gammaproteobacteria bacterium]|nr:DUF2892 domain-containing protein [Gammaproteobacteria bacterium]
MDRLKGDMPDPHNMGLIDRAIRFFVGGALIFIGVISLVVTDTVQIWQALLVLFSVYPLMTCMMGWDPVYQVLSIRTGADYGRNVTGTLPYQVDAAMSRKPQPDKDYEYDHSLTGSHH